LELNHQKTTESTLEDQIETGYRAHYFGNPDGHVRLAYLAAVRLQLAQWMQYTYRACNDQAWLDYQQEIALRHAPAPKHLTDEAAAVADHIPTRYMIAYNYPISATIKPFLSKKGHSAGDIRQAWFKAIVLEIFWRASPYAQTDIF
jgi:hypothetical protein